MNFLAQNLKDFYKDHSGKSWVCVYIIVIELMYIEYIIYIVYIIRING